MDLNATLRNNSNCGATPTRELSYKKLFTTGYIDIFIDGDENKVSFV